MIRKQPEHPTTAETLIAPIPSNRIPTNVPVILHEEINQPRQQTRSPIYGIVGSFFLSAGMVGATAYAYLNELGPFSHPSKPTDTAAPSVEPAPTAEPITLPQIIDSPEKLKISLEAYNIKSTPADFQKTDQKNLYMDGLTLEPILDEKEEVPQALQYRWVPLKGQKFATFKDEEILIATMVKKPTFSAKLRHLGIQPLATVSDSENPDIQYHYYHCTKPGSPGIASISIVNDREHNLTLYPLHLPVCKPSPEENPKL